MSSLFFSSPISAKCDRGVSSENCSTPPTTPLDELALKRHRFFADLIDAANNAIEQRVRFDSIGANVETPMNSKFACGKKHFLWHFFFVSKQIFYEFMFN